MDAQNRCPPMNNNIAPMPTQNPWVWVGMGMGMGMGTQCRALLHTMLRDQRTICECKMDVKSTWIFIWHRLDHASWSL